MFTAMIRAHSVTALALSALQHVEELLVYVEREVKVQKPA